MVLAQIFAAIIVLIIIGVIVWGYYYQNRRKHLLLKLKEMDSLPPPNEHAVFFEGIVTKPVYYAPFDGQECGFFALHIWKKTSSLIKKAGLGTLNAFELVYLSGDFFVQHKTSNQEYRIAVVDCYEQFLGSTIALSQFARPFLAGEKSQRKDSIIEINAQNRASESALSVLFGYYNGKAESGTRVSVPFYQKNVSTIYSVKPKANIDFKVQEFTVGNNLPDRIIELLRKKSAFDQFLQNGDVLVITQLAIPIGQGVFVSGTQGSSANSILLRPSQIGISISYKDPSK
jgi:hypothetical protein